MKIITLCGSTDFFEEYDKAMLELTIQGWAVFTIGTHRFNDKQLVIDNKLKERFEKLHFDKIRLSDAIMVIDKNGYIGESTTREIKYAIKYKKPVYSYLETNKVGNWTNLKNMESCILIITVCLNRSTSTTKGNGRNE